MPVGYAGTWPLLPREMRCRTRSQLFQSETGMSGSLFLQIGDIPGSIALDGCDDLVERFSSVLPGWQFRPVTSDDRPLVSVRRSSDGYHLNTAWQEHTQRYFEEVEILGALVAKLSRMQALNDLESLCLHAAAVEFNGRLVVFPNRGKSGKSFLSVCLAAAGYRLFCDDVLPVGLDDLHAVAPGIAPMLRLPLPASIDAVASEFIASHVVLEGSRYLFVNPGDEWLHPLGTRLPIGAIVLLDRQDSVTARLDTVAPATMLRQSIWQNFARDVEADKVLDGLARIVSGVECLQLTYDSADEAIDLMARFFETWHDEPRVDAPRGASAPAAADSEPDLDHGQLIQSPGVKMLSIDDQVFLTSRDGNAIHHLNPIGAAIWAQLSEPTARQDIVTLLATAFPDHDRNAIGKDVDKLVKSLLASKLLRKQ